MRIQTTAVRALALALCLCCGVFALPADRTHYVAIHQNPANPNSRVQYYFAIAIHAEDQDGDDIGWAVTNFKIVEKALLGSDTIWDVDDPDVDTADGLWWVTHTDPDNPVRAEFIQPPPIADTASTTSPSSSLRGRPT